jgi:hypothetical protein
MLLYRNFDSARLHHLDQEMLEPDLTPKKVDKTYLSSY